MNRAWIIALLLFFPALASAQTVNPTRADLISTLYALVHQLEAEIAQIEAAQATSTVTVSAPLFTMVAGNVQAPVRGNSVPPVTVASSTCPVPPPVENYCLVGKCYLNITIATPGQNPVFATTNCTN
jgi:hypothetical protein